MNFLKSHFWYNKRQRNGILFLIIIILIFQIIYVFVDFTSDKDLELDKSETEFYQKQIDSLKVIEEENSRQRIYPFNPNYLTDFKGYQLGMSVQEIDKLLAFRETGKFVNTNKEFQKVTGINDSLLAIISPYFKFPEWVNSDKNKNLTKQSGLENTPGKKVRTGDLNLVNAMDLQSINGIGEKLAKRIIAYRILLQGFTYDEQLYEVYYLGKDIANKVLEKFKVMEKPNISKINLNEATFKEILHLPYIDYDLTKKICNYRNEINQYSDLEELKKIDSFPLEKFDRIALYLTADKKN